MRAANAQMSLHIRRVSSQPLLPELKESSDVDEGSGPTLFHLRQWFCCCWFLPLVCRGSVFGPRFSMHFLEFFFVLQSSRWGTVSKMPHITVFLLLVFCGCSSRCHGLVWSMWLWFFLIILAIISMSQFIRVWYLSLNQAETNQSRPHICAVSPEPLKIALKWWGVDEGSAKF